MNTPNFVLFVSFVVSESYVSKKHCHRGRYWRHED